MNVTIVGVIERTFRCSTPAPPHAPGAVQHQVRVVLRQHPGATARVHAILPCGLGDAGEHSAGLLRARLTAGKHCTLYGKHIQPLSDTMDVLMLGCAEAHTHEVAARQGETP